MDAVVDIEKLSLENNNFRKVVATLEYSQIVVMSLLPNEDIGEEIHEVDQIIHIIRGAGIAKLNDYTIDIKEKRLIVIPAGTKHNIINSNLSIMKLYTIYAPSNEPKGLIQKFKD